MRLLTALHLAFWILTLVAAVLAMSGVLEKYNPTAVIIWAVGIGCRLWAVRLKKSAVHRGGGETNSSSHGRVG